MAKTKAGSEIEEFAALLDGAADDGSEELSELAGLVKAIEAAAPTPESAPADVRRSIRQSILAEAERRRPVTERAAGWVAARNRAWRRSLRMVGAMTLAVVSLLGSAALVAASENVSPDHPLYAIKKGRESARLAVARGDEARGAMLTTFARRRLTEVNDMTNRRVPEAGLYIDTLADMNGKTSEARTLLIDVFDKTGRIAPLEALDSLTTLQVDVLSTVVDRVPVAARAAVRESIGLAERISRETHELLRSCDDCGTPGVSQPLPQEPSGVEGGPGANGPVTCECAPRGGSDDRGGTVTDPRPKPSPSEEPTDEPTEEPTEDPRTVPDVPGTIDDDVEDIIDDILESPAPTPTLPPAPGGLAPTPGVTVPGLP